MGAASPPKNRLPISISLAANGDGGRLTQVAWNLLGNAVKFTPEGGSVDLTARRNGASLAITVTDTGAGIPAEMLSRIFEPFEQVDASMTRRHGGLGLGLAIARQIVVAHGGSIEAQSEGAGRGASFTVTLPAIDPPPLAAASTDATFTEHHALVGSRPRRRR